MKLKIYLKVEIFENRESVFSNGDVRVNDMYAFDIIFQSQVVLSCFK